MIFINKAVIKLFMAGLFLLAFGGCDLLDPTAGDNTFNNFTRDNPNDFGVWTEEEPITSLPDDISFSPFVSIGNRLYSIARKYGDYDPETETSIIPEYYLGILTPGDNWSWVTADGPDLTLDSAPDSQSFRHEDDDAYFVGGDILYWLGNVEYSEGSYNTFFQAFNPESGSWDDLATFPIENYKQTRTADASGMVYVGVDSNGVYEYNPDTDVWRDLNVDQISRSFNEVITIGNTLWVLECYLDNSLEFNWQTKELNAIRVYSVDLIAGGVTQTYQRLDEHMENVHCFVMGNIFYIFTGGISSWSSTSTTSELLDISMGNEVYKFDCENPANEIQKVSTFPDVPYIPDFSLNGPDSFFIFYGNQYTEGGIDNWETDSLGATTRVTWAWEYTPSLDSWNQIKAYSENYTTEMLYEYLSIPITPFLWGDSFYVCDGDKSSMVELYLWSYKMRSYD
ncbi:MAG: hypothetical protein JEY99_17705 [Spirochaetales bacterium]|nr:hypothetical protein [Spirochaetales bacterium]